MKSVAIIILNWNKPDLTIDTIDSVLKINHPNFNYHLYLLDNGSTDNSFNILKQKYSTQNKITFIRSKVNLGFGNGNNFAVKQAQKDHPDFILLLNNDVLVDPDFLQILIKYSEKNPRQELLSPKIYFAPGFEFHHDRYQKKDLGRVIWFVGGIMDWQNINGYHRGVDQIDNGQFDKVYLHSDFLTGCCLLVKSSVISEIGLFDDKYYMYLEDADFSQKAIRNNFHLAVVPQSKIWHLNAGSSGVGGSLQDYFLSRNRLLFGFRYASLKTKFALLRESVVKLLFSPYKWQKNGIRDYFLGKFNRGSWQ